ncbi:cystathionine gamma-synthase family protein [Aliagarivorans marinus]|uniref:cystathionine gamma-synthase family protein n=1 Tax=Aliagarivorans marinus TaxID=561965 RepID=UPI0003FD0488|nr:cystathionine gamma-synthase family protein [Aliagarivorans marinus]
MKLNGLTTKIVHYDRMQGVEFGGVHAPVHASVPYAYAQSQDLVDVFQGKQTGHAYSRQSTPTLDYLQGKLAMMEQSVGCLLFASGMAAITTTFITLLKAGDHIIASRHLFGNTSSVFGTLRGFGVEVSLVDATDAANIAACAQENTKLVFVETIANPATQIADLKGIGELCQQHSWIYVVDNTLTSPLLFQPKSVGASLIINSLSKYVGGHGAVLGGSVSDTGLYDWQGYPNIFEGYRKGDPMLWGLNQIKKKGLRDFGGCLSSESAHKLSMGVETLALRMQRQCDNAQALAEMLAAHPKVARVYYPGLAEHPQHQRAASLFSAFGALVSFDLLDTYQPVAFLDSLHLVLNATHLGDNRTLALPVAQTIYYEMGLQARQAAQISENMIRCSIGIEDQQDLLDDFKLALEAL